MSFLLLVAVIVLWFLALLIWNVSAMRIRTLFSLAGCARLIAGAIFVFGALALLYFAFPGLRREELSPLATGSFLAALIADIIIGDDVRHLFLSRRRP